VKHEVAIPLVTTIRERCRVCYTCVRECPAKAIRIATGQAEVIPERCIGCGNCVRVCSQHAKKIASGIERAEALLAGGGRVAALVAPSFPAEFAECDDGGVVGVLRAMGFAVVSEVGFGADLVARRYRELLAESGGRRYIATTCPAMIAYVEKYHPPLVPSLAPIVSPMVATARVLHRLHGPDLRTVFIGPCIAKKGEAASAHVAGEIDAVLTFAELREMLAARKLDPAHIAPSEFDPPRAGAGSLLPIARGLFQAADVKEDLLNGEVVAAEGRDNFGSALEEFESGDLDARLLEVLCCKGCIMGAGMSCRTPHFSRRRRVSQRVRRRASEGDAVAWQAAMDRFADLDLGRVFEANDQRIAVPVTAQIADIMARMGKAGPEDELNCGACGYDTCREHAVAIYKGLAENEMCLPFTIDQLKRAVRDLAVSNEQLATAQEALMQSEKLASMGQLAAGIAHEVNNPLGVVLMYAHLLLEECDRNSQLYEDLGLIAEQADRCKKIVAGLLHFARQNKVLLQPSDLADLVERALRATPAPEGVTVEVIHEAEDRAAEVDRDQVIQVLANLVSNGFAAMPAGGRLTIRTRGDASHVRLVVTDTGVGIPRENLAKIFEPFFTTKQIGMGTGLGLAVTYGIVKMHRGEIDVTSNADPAAGPTGTTFTVTLPRKGRQE
jgi:signal transduction histidine kinase/Pyruvate/2-oxoacid:ferredoxin oxidoreductase delta subunit